MDKISEKFNEYSSFKEVAIRTVKNSFINSSKLDNEWKKLRFHSRPGKFPLRNSTDPYKFLFAAQ